VMGWTVLVVALVLAGLTMLSREKHGADLSAV
jgi:hypothetical protein